MSNAFSPPVIQKSKVNNTTLLTIEDHNVPVVHFAVALKVGAIVDPYQRSGLLKILLNLMLKGTEKKSRHAFNLALETLGSSIDAIVGNEVALFRGVTLTRNLETTVNLLTEALTEPLLAQEELESYLQEHIEGLRSERDDDDTVADLFVREHLYPDHVLKRSPNGTLQELAQLTIADLQHLHKTLFTQHTIVCAFAGDINEATAQTLTQKLTGQLPDKQFVAEIMPFVPHKAPLKIIVIDKPERTQVQLRLATHTLTGTQAEMYPFWLGAVAFGGTFTSTLCREVRDIRGWSYVAHAELRRRTRFLAPLILRSAPANKDAVDCLALELTLCENLAQGHIDNEHLHLAQSYLLNRYPFDVQSGSDLLYPAVLNEILGYPPDEIFNVPHKLEAVQFSQVPTILTRYLADKPYLAVLVATAETVLPALKERFHQAEIIVKDYREGIL